MRHPGWPGDIVHRSFLNSVLAAVEIKAGPSRRADQKKGYVKDIARLLRLRELRIAGFFVLLDKSSAFYGNFVGRRGPSNCINWEPVVGQANTLVQIIGNMVIPGLECADWHDILVSRDKPSKRFIEIYNVSAVNDREILYYTYRQCCPGIRANAGSAAAQAGRFEP